MRRLPALTQETQPFWTGGAEGRLLISRCGDCRRYAHPPLPVCPACRSRAMAAEPVSGRGRVESCTVNHQAWLPGMPVPFVFAAVELQEQAGLFLLTNIVNCPVEQVRIDMRVRVLFEPHEDVWLPVFEPSP